MINQTDTAVLNRAENTTFSQKSEAILAEMDAVVDRFIAEIKGAAEKKAKNASKKEEINRNNSENIAINRNDSENIEIRRHKSENTNPDAQKSQKKSNWNFSGSAMREILRFSSIKAKDLHALLGVSKDTFGKYLNLETIPPEITKKIAHQLDINSSEGLWEYYEMIPKSVKESIKYDMRITRPITGIPLSTDVYRAAMALGRMNEVLEALDIRDGR